MLQRFVIVLMACGLAAAAFAQSPAPHSQPGSAPAKQAVATFAGGCFWCVEADFDKVEGVISTTSGYTGGHIPNPTYQQVSAGGTGHAESVEVVYDPSKVSYEKLLDYFWHHHDPLTRNAQFCDHGTQYRAAIFYHDEEQRRLAEASKEAVQAELKQPVQTEITPAGPFYQAEEYHQDYYLKNPIRYKFYRYNCGRERRIEQVWGKTDKSS